MKLSLLNSGKGDQTRQPLGLPLFFIDLGTQLVGFGAFEVKYRAERTGRNPKTRESIKIPAYKVPVFKPGKALKDIVAQQN